MRLQYKFALSVSALITLVIMGIGTMSILSEKHLLESEMNKHFTDLVRRLAKVSGESLYQNDLVVFNYLKELEKERGYIGACFTNNDGIIRVHSDTQLIGKKLEDKYLLKNLPNGENLLWRDEDQSTLRYAWPVEFAGNQMGVVYLFLNENVIQDFVRKSLLSTMKRWLPIIIGAFAIGLLGAFLLASTMVKPIQEVVSRMQEVGKGRLVPFPSNHRKDELGWMGAELNKTIIKLKELDDMKQEFISAVTHELRSPLTAIERFVSLMIKQTYGTINSEQKEALQTVKNNSVRLGQFVDEVLTVSKMESKRTDLFLENFDISPVIRDVIKFFEPVALDRKISLNYHHTDKPKWVRADKDKVIQILTNLISNAIKFTEKGSVDVTVLEHKDSISVAIADTGCGISEEDKKRVFEKFYRAALTAHKVKGTGLGLFIAKSFLELQNGSIVVEDNHKNGSIFRFTLPKGNTSNSAN